MDDFYAARSRTIPPLPWLVFAPPRSTRGSVCDAMVEAIDMLPTFLDACGIDESRHRLEGSSLIPLLADEKPSDWRDFAFSEIDYSFYQASEELGVDISLARAYAIQTKSTKYIYFKGFRPQLFDLEADPKEFRDLGSSANHATLIREMQSKLLERLTDRRNRITLPDEAIPAMRPHRGTRGIMIGRW